MSRLLQQQLKPGHYQNTIVHVHSLPSFISHQWPLIHDQFPTAILVGPTSTTHQLPTLQYRWLSFFLKKKREKYEELLRSRSFIEKDKTLKKDVLIN